MAYNAKEIIKVLESRGWVLDRIRGSHHVYKNSKTGQCVPVPVHGKKDLSKGLFYNILKQCDIDKNDI
jgi:predicted RNA binding protein YcfA (HicA-like mRNA interferase family)